MEVLLVSLCFFVLAGTAGAMLLFGGLVAPAVLAHLGRDEGERLMALLLPRYQLALAAALAASALLLALDGRIEAAALAALLAGASAYARQILGPRLAALHGRAERGDEAAEADLDRGRRHAATLNLMQFLAILALCWRLVTG